MNDNDSEEDVLMRDRMQYPKCYHSTSIQTFFSFSSTSGQTNDVQKTISRVCPGEPPVPIFKQQTNSESGHTSNMDEDMINSFTQRKIGDHDINGGIDSFINSFFGESILGGGRERNDTDSIFGFDMPFGGLFGGHHPRRGDSDRLGGFFDFNHRREIEGQRVRREEKFDKDAQAVMQPPHSLPKGKSPSIREYHRDGLRGVEISPPENI
mgnify:FL=1